MKQEAISTVGHLGKMHKAALQAFFGIAQKWQLSAEHERKLLGNPPRSTFYLWKKNKNGCIGRDVLERVSYIMGIYKALRILLPSERAANEWIKKENRAPLFHGQSALDRMLAGNVVDLAVVRQYVDSMRG